MSNKKVAVIFLFEVFIDDPSDETLMSPPDRLFEKIPVGELLQAENKLRALVNDNSLSALDHILKIRFVDDQAD